MYGFVVVPIIVFTGSSRVYEGLHSLDQVLSGTVQGILTSYLFSDVLFERLDSLIYDSAKTMPHLRVLFGNWFAIIIWMSMIIFHLVYTHIEDTYKLPDEWKVVILDKCPNLTPQETDSVIYCYRFLVIQITLLTSLLGVSIEGKVFKTHVYTKWN